jgi:hypothetical protein
MKLDVACSGVFCFLQETESILTGPLISMLGQLRVCQSELSISN